MHWLFIGWKSSGWPMSVCPPQVCLCPNFGTRYISVYIKCITFVCIVYNVKYSICHICQTWTVYIILYIYLSIYARVWIPVYICPNMRKAMSNLLKLSLFYIIYCTDKGLFVSLSKSMTHVHAQKLSICACWNFVVVVSQTPPPAYTKVSLYQKDQRCVGQIGVNTTSLRFEQFKCSSPTFYLNI